MYVDKKLLIVLAVAIVALAGIAWYAVDTVVLQENVIEQLSK